MELNREEIVVGSFNPVSRKTMEWDVVNERRNWASSCGGYRIERYSKDDFYVYIDAGCAHGSRRVANYSSKKAAVHFLEHVASSNAGIVAARTFAAPVYIDWKRKERGIYTGNPSITGCTNDHREVIRMEQHPDGWSLHIGLGSGWWGWYADCGATCPNVVIEAVENGKTVRFKSKKAASMAAEYAVRDILGHWSGKFNFRLIPESIDKYFGSEDRCRGELKALIVEAEGLGMCEDMFLAHAFAHAARSGLPTVVECAESAKALMAVWREHGQ